jgi:hypothetical protein
MDVLGRYSQQSRQMPPDVLDDFDRVAREAPPEAVGEGLEDAFNAEVTPPFEQMVGQLYGRSDPHQRAGLLREILGSRFSPDEAAHMPVNEVETAAADAARENPGIIQRVSRFYAQHPQLVQTLGQVALSVAMSGMARRRRM